MIQTQEMLIPTAVGQTKFSGRFSGHEVAFVDMAIKQHVWLTAGIRAGVEIVLLNAQQDGVEQVTQMLRKRQNLSCIHLVSPGALGSLHLGAAVLNLHTLERYVWDLTIWSNALAPNAELLIYGSEVARGVRGEEFVGHLCELVGAKIAASRSKTGSLTLGGNWSLELQTKPCQTALAFNPETMASYNDLL